MWGAIIGAAISAASAIYGGIKSSEAAKEANKKVEDMQRENQAWYDGRYNEDPLQRTSAQRVLTKTQETLRQRDKAAAGRAAVMGGTEESVAAEKARSTEALAEAASRIAAQGDAQKDAIEQQYRANKMGLTQQQIGIEQQRANNIAQATAGVGKAVGGAVSGIEGGNSDKGPGNGMGATKAYLTDDDSKEKDWWKEFFNENQTKPGRQNYK